MYKGITGILVTLLKEEGKPGCVLVRVEARGHSQTCQSPLLLDKPHALHDKDPGLPGTEPESCRRSEFTYVPSGLGEDRL